jgi:regulatory protein
VQKRARKPVRKKPNLSLRARALQYLARREYSRAELRSKLLKYVQADADAEFDSGQSQLGELDTLLDDLTARGWLSDERAVTQLVHAKRSRFGTQRITHELRQKGIAEELISAALPELKNSELEAARSVWQRKFGTAPQDAKEKAKQMRFLQSRGFSMDVIFKVMKLSNSAEDESF